MYALPFGAITAKTISEPSFHTRCSSPVPAQGIYKIEGALY
jgi:hypothetical protein